MDALQILLVGRSPTVMDVVQPTLSRLLPRYSLQVVQPVDAQQRVARGGVVACLVCVQHEAQVAQLLQVIQSRDPAMPLFVITGQQDAIQRLRFLELGVVDCCSWPVDFSRLAALIEMLAVRRRLAAERLLSAASANSPPQSVAGFLFLNSFWRENHGKVQAAAHSDTTILLTGETGTGKSHVARAIHGLSPRKEEPFVVVECGGLSPTLLESELFGHMRGAFTGADRDHVGKFSTAQEGTILLDEIDCVPLEAQAKLLRVLEERVFEPVGSSRTSKCKARVIAATNQPLDELVAAGRFRSDLFFRLNVVEFRLPPLRDCRETVVPLADKFLELNSQRLKRNKCNLTPAALRALQAYHWPGNIRELRNTIERATTLTHREEIDVDDLGDAIRTANAGEASTEASTTGHRNELACAREGGEIRRIQQALMRHENNRTRAAKELGISRVALYKKLHKFGLI
ncbi:MAG: sigma-54 dependent transcriptional regulator [Planctomycetes bacterium]|nr:sigma-54 dependent transcriptional regulator [Planctomycetota bacterium]